MGHWKNGYSEAYLASGIYYSTISLSDLFQVTLLNIITIISSIKFDPFHVCWRILRGGCSTGSITRTNNYSIYFQKRNLEQGNHFEFREL